MLEADCHAGRLTFDGERVTISRKGFANFLVHGLAGEKVIPVASITAVQLRKPGAFTSGYIQFSVKGGRESVGGLMEASKDENSVLFTAERLRAVEKIHEAVMRRLSDLSAPVPAPTSGADELEKLAALRDRGILTDDEFTAKKRQILGL